MDFLKKHYEKLLLGVMLVGLIGALVFMLFYIAADKSEMAEKVSILTNPRVVELTNLDMTDLDAAIARAQAPYQLDLDSTNKLFNPLEWQRGLDGNLLLAAKRTGPEVAVVFNITPLYYIVSLDSVITNELGSRYVIQFERQNAPTVAKRRPTRHYVSKDDKPNPNDGFALMEVKGAPEAPDALVLKLTDTGELITITKDHSYRRVDGYMADFRYDPERKVFKSRRAGDHVSFGGVDYVVVDVGQNELVLQDQSNLKKTSLPFNP